jgi:hypothetical protein
MRRAATVLALAVAGCASTPDGSPAPRSVSNGNLVRLAGDTFAPIERWRVGTSSAVTNMAFGDDTVWLATDSRAVIRIDVGS